MRGERIKEEIATLRALLILDLATLLPLIAWVFKHAGTSGARVVNTAAVCAFVSLVFASIGIVALLRRLEDERS